MSVLRVNSGTADKKTARGDLSVALIVTVGKPISACRREAEVQQFDLQDSRTMLGMFGRV